MAGKIPFTALIESLPSTVPFVGPETQERERGEKFAARIGANENVFGPSPKAIAKMQAVAGDIWQYADPENFELKEALAAHHGVSVDNIAIGEGLDGLLGLCVRLFINQGDAVITSYGGYPTFNFHVDGFGGKRVEVPYDGDFENLDGLIDAMITHKAKLCYVVNPDNPMASFWPKAEMQAMFDKVPEGSLLLVDEAYCEFAPQGELPDLDVENPQILRLRTFSKAYGMAGARVGYAIGHKNLVSAFDKIRNHFGMNRTAQIAAISALEDHEWLSYVVDEVNKSKARIGKIAEENGLKALPSATNFIAIDCGQEVDFAKAIVAGLMKYGIFIRMPFVEPHNRCIRVSAGKPEHLDLLEKALPIVLAEARKAL